MKNGRGMVRSKEVMKAASSKADFKRNESSESSEKAPYAPELHHLEVYPKNEKGEVKITHHLGSVAAPSESHAFDAKDGEQMVRHIMEHTGMPYDSEGGGDHYADEEKAATA